MLLRRPFAPLAPLSPLPCNWKWKSGASSNISLALPDVRNSFPLIPFAFSASVPSFPPSRALSSNSRCLSSSSLISMFTRDLTFSLHQHATLFSRLVSSPAIASRFSRGFSSLANFCHPNFPVSSSHSRHLSSSLSSTSSSSTFIIRASSLSTRLPSLSASSLFPSSETFFQPSTPSRTPVVRRLSSPLSPVLSFHNSALPSFYRPDPGNSVAPANDPGQYSVDNPPPMTVRRILFVALPIGLCSGIVGAISGVGGAVVLIPLLTSVAGYKQAQATATGVLCSFVTALTGSIAYALNGCVHIPAAVVIGLCASATVGIGAKLATRANERTLQLVVALVMALLSPLVLFKSLQKEKVAPATTVFPTSTSDRSSSPSPPSPASPTSRPPSAFDTSLSPYFFLAAGGSGLGLINGSIGFGGAITMASVLNLTQDLHHLPYAVVSGTVLSSIIVPSGVGAWKHYKLGNLIRISRLPFLLGGTIVGSLIGAELAVKLPEQYPQMAFALFLATTGCRQIWLKLRNGVAAKTAATKSIANSASTSASASLPNATSSPRAATI